MAFTSPVSPTFSVIITTHNRPRLVRRCVENVLGQDFSREDYEIIVVDDGSKQATAQVLEPYRTQIDYVWQAQAGWGKARLTGVQRSKGKILVFLDDDCCAPAGWLGAYTRVYQEKPEVDGVAGALRYGARVNVAGFKQYTGHVSYFNRLNQPLGTTTETAGRVWFSFGGNRSFRRDVWMSAQPDKMHWYGDDSTIDQTLKERGALIYYTPDAWVEHYYVLSVTDRMRSAYRYGLSETRLPENILQAPNMPTSIKRPAIPAWEYVWYEATQPLVWLARWVGKWSA